MPETVISFTTIEFSNAEMMEKPYDIFHGEYEVPSGQAQARRYDKVSFKFPFLPEDKLMFGNWLEYRDMEAFEACDYIWKKTGEDFAKKH